MIQARNEEREEGMGDQEIFIWWDISENLLFTDELMF